MVSLAYFRNGQKVDDGTLTLATADLSSWIYAHFRNFTLADIKAAIDNGVFGRYGEFHGVSVRAIVEWLQAYQTDPARIARQQTQQQAAKAIAPKATVTEAELDEMRRRSVRDKFEQYLHTGDFLDIHSTSYDFLARIGVLQPTAAEKRAIYDKYLKAETAQVEKRAKAGAVPIGVALKDLALSNAVEKSKHYFLARFFDDVIRNGNEITDYV